MTVALLSGTIVAEAYEYIDIEAEDAAITSPMQIATDGSASGGEYIFTPTSNDGEAEFSMTLLGGDYVVWALCAATLPNAPAHNSFRISVDGGTVDAWDMFEDDILPQTSWTWERISTRCGGAYNDHGCDPLVLMLGAGTHTIQILGRESLTRLDRIIVTDDLSFDPTGSNPAPDTSITLGWDAPTQNEDGSQISTLGGFKVHVGNESRVYVETIDIGVQTIVTIPELSPYDQHFFAVTAYNAENVESDYSEELVWKYDDGDLDGMSDAWEIENFGGTEAPSGDVHADADGDGHSNYEEYIAGTSPTGGTVEPLLTIAPSNGALVVSYETTASVGAGYEIYDRYFTVKEIDSLVDGEWTPVPGLEHVLAQGQTAQYPILPSGDGPCKMYRVEVSLEPKGP